MLSVVRFFGRVKCYSPELAKHIGIDKSALLWELIYRYGDSPFPTVSVGEYKVNSWFELVEDNYIITSEAGHRINFSKLESLIPKDETIKEITPTFQDDVFINLCSRWYKILKDKGRRKTLGQIYKLFEGRSKEESLKALKRVTDNGWITLQFDENPKSDDKGIRTSGAIRASGGSKNTGGGADHSHLTRRLG